MNEKKILTLDEAFEKFLTSRIANGAKDITLKTYRGHFRSIAKHLDTTRLLPTITKDDIERMIVSMRSSSLSDTSIQTYTRCLKTFYNWANEVGLSTMKVKLYKADKTMKEPYSDTELRKLLAEPEVNCDFWELRGWTIINFLINSGCRAATLRAIKIKDVDFDCSIVVYRHNKNGQTQSIPLCSAMQDILIRYLARRGGSGDDPLFCNDHYLSYKYPALRKAIEKYNHSRGVTKISIHLFRHTFAKKFLLDCGGNAFTLQHLLGHKTLEMTKRYCDIYDKDIINRFEEICPLNRI